MNKLFRKITAALCAGIVLCTSAAMPVGAEEEKQEAITLPSGDTLQQVQRELEDYHNEQTGLDETRQYAAAAIGIFQGDEVLLEGYYGDIDIANQIAADENSVFVWGSITKTLVWVSAMQLWEQGMLDLDRDVREYLPDDFFQYLSYDDPITMMNIMNHNVGFQESMRSVIEAKTEQDILPLKEALMACEPSQINRPGEAVAYSNYAAAVAGYVIECITGQEFCDYVHEHIFEPLGMEHTALNPTRSDNMWVYENWKKTRSYTFGIFSTVDHGNVPNYISAYPAGAACGTMRDLMTYAQALANDDAPLFQNKETQEVLYTATDFYGTSDIPLCAHGFFYTEHGVRTIGHTGATLAGQADMEFDPVSKTGLIVMINEPNGNWYLSTAPMLVFGSLSPEKYASGTPEKRKLNGRYSMLRGIYRGMLKFYTFLEALNLSNLGEAEYLGNGVYQITSEDSAILLGEKTYSDGSTGFAMASSDLIPVRSFMPRLCLLTLYVLVAVAAVFELLIRRKLKKHKKWKAHKGASLITAGQIARIVSVIAWLVAFMIYANDTGISYTQGAVIGITQMLAAAVCVLSAIVSCIAIVPNLKDKVLTARYLLNTVCCVLPVIAIVHFELYWFWSM